MIPYTNFFFEKDLRKYVSAFHQSVTSILDFLEFSFLLSAYHHPFSCGFWVTAQKGGSGASFWSRLTLLSFLHCCLLLRSTSHTGIGILEANGQYYIPCSKDSVLPGPVTRAPCLFSSGPPQCLRNACCLFSHPNLPISILKRGCWIRSLLTPLCCQSQTTTFLFKETTCSFAFMLPACRKKSKANSIRFVSKALFMFIRHSVKHNGLYTCWNILLSQLPIHCYLVKY